MSVRLEEYSLKIDAVTINGLAGPLLFTGESIFIKISTLCAKVSNFIATARQNRAHYKSLRELDYLDERVMRDIGIDKYWIFYQINKGSAKADTNAGIKLNYDCSK